MWAVLIQALIAIANCSGQYSLRPVLTLHPLSSHQSRAEWNLTRLHLLQRSYVMFVQLMTQKGLRSTQNNPRRANSLPLTGILQMCLLLISDLPFGKFHFRFQNCQVPSWHFRFVCTSNILGLCAKERLGGYEVATGVQYVETSRHVAQSKRGQARVQTSDLGHTAAEG